MFLRVKRTGHKPRVLPKTKMDKASILIVLSLLFASILHSGSSLKCYSCEKCNDPFKKEGANTDECSSVCMKVKALTDGPVFKKGDVERSCKG